MTGPIKDLALVPLILHVDRSLAVTVCDYKSASKAIVMHD